MRISRLIYSSTPRPGLTYDQLTSILRAAIVSNAAQSITGLLCYTGGTFLQVLEGPRSGISRVYNRITRDDRHEACELLSVEDVSTRAFPEWAMKLVRDDGDMTADRRAVIRRHTAGDASAVRALSAVQAAALLIELAHLERAPASRADPTSGEWRSAV